MQVNEHAVTSTVVSRCRAKTYLCIASTAAVLTVRHLIWSLRTRGFEWLNVEVIAAHEYVSGHGFVEVFLSGNSEALPKGRSV